MPLNHRLNFAKHCTVFSSFTHNLSEYSPFLETEVYREHSSMLNQRNWGWSKITFIFLSENLKWRVSCMQNNMLGPFIFYGHFFLEVLSLFSKCGIWDIKLSLVIYSLTLYLKGRWYLIQAVHLIKGYVMLLDYANFTNGDISKRYFILPAGQLMNPESLPVLFLNSVVI